MKKYKYIIALIIISSFYFFINNDTILAYNEKKEVLFISSYSPSFNNFIQQSEGLKKSIDKDINIQIEYMDYGNFSDKENEKNFYNLLKYKLSKYSNLKAIILGDDPAIEFGKRYKESLFKDIPIIFMGANNKELANEMIKYDDVYGILEEISIKENIDLINQLHPNNNIVALTYQKSDEVNELKEFYDLKNKYTNINFKHISVFDIGVEKAKEELHKLNGEDVLLEIYLYNGNKDNSLEYDTRKEITEYINKNIDIPKYKTLDIYNYNKFIGGKVTNHFEQGKKAGEIANIILDNKKPKQNLIEGSEVNTYIFNYDILKKYGLEEQNLPPNSYIKNKTLSFWEKYSEIIIPGGIVLVSLLITTLVLLVDVIRRKEYEKEILKAKEIAENANRVQSDFISNISHELRTPVAVIMSSNQLLDINLSQLDEETVEKSINNTKIIKQNCFRLLRIINNIIDIAKVDSGFMNLREKNVEIISLLEYLTQSVVPYAKSKNIDVIFDTEKEEVIVAVDPDKIERIVLNLLSNAIKFSKDNGQISLNVYLRKEKIFFVVEDNGVGIDEKNLEKIFDKFVQIEGTLIRKNEGSGIGLSLVKSFVELHEGSVYVDSKLNEGSKFTVSLPIRVIENEKFYTYSMDSNGEGVISTNVELSDII